MNPVNKQKKGTYKISTAVILGGKDGPKKKRSRKPLKKGGINLCGKGVRITRNY